MIKSPEHGFFEIVKDSDGLHPYHANFDDFFDAFASIDNDLHLDGGKAHNRYCVEHVWGATPLEIELDAYEILDNWEESLSFCPEESLWTAEQAEELQAILDAWTEKQITGYFEVDKCLSLGRPIKIPVPWCEWFGVEEREEEVGR